MQTIGAVRPYTYLGVSHQEGVQPLLLYMTEELEDHLADIQFEYNRQKYILGDQEKVDSWLENYYQTLKKYANNRTKRK